LKKILNRWAEIFKRSLLGDGEVKTIGAFKSLNFEKVSKAEKGK